MLIPLLSIFLGTYIYVVIVGMRINASLKENLRLIGLISIAAKIDIVRYSDDRWMKRYDAFEEATKSRWILFEIWKKVEGYYGEPWWIDPKEDPAAH